MTSASEIEAAIAELRAAVADVEEPPIETPYLRNSPMRRLFIAAKKVAALPPVDVRRAPVQGCRHRARVEMPARFIERWGHNSWGIPPGSIPWADHLRVYAAYTARYGSDQSAERIAERQGFGIGEIVMLGCGDVLERWEPR